ncbi:MAG: flavodoxin-dependent (E)-4-hydroxy-3-methylbut-2-enyl-diphosphate synthase [Erysipelotrichaceae bacterium]
MKRSETLAIKVGNKQIGHQNKVIIQSMCNTKTKDVEASVKQILELEAAGCEIVRLAIADNEDALAIKAIKERTHVPLVADIHYDYRLAIASIENGIDKIRLNPGNIGSIANVQAVVKVCKQYNIPIRIGINSGSLDKNILDKYGCVCAEAMIESAAEHVKILTDLNFNNIVLSFKSSDVLMCVDAYRLASTTFPYPLHLGVTEAGTMMGSAIKSSVALGILLQEGIGDTIRVSVNGDPVNELLIAKQLLKSVKLIENVPNLIACPTCGRTQFNITPLVNEVETFLQTIHCDIDVAIMGCAVNGPGEAKNADIAIAGGKDEGLLIKKGIIIKKLKTEEMLPTLKAEILAFEQAHIQTK